jgi:hypothetical protein
MVDDLYGPISKSPPPATMVKLDRVLCTVDWEDLYPNCLLQSLVTNDNFSGTKSFHFKAFWPQLQGFQEVVATSWNAVPLSGNPCIVIKSVICFICLALKLSSKSVMSSTGAGACP